MDKFNQIISRYKNARVIIIGDVLLDEYIFGNVSRISPEAPVPVVKVKSQSYALGGAANVANNIKSLGGSPYLIGVIGKGYFGDMVRDLMLQNKIQTNYLVEDPVRPTTLKTRVIAQNQQVVRVDTETNEKISARILNEIIKRLENMDEKIKVIVLSDYGKGVVTPAMVQKVRNIAAKYGAKICVDPKTEHFKSYKNMDIMTPNTKEAAEGMGLKITSDAELKTAGFKILKHLKLKSLLITRGSSGMALFEKGKLKLIPTFAKNVYDVTGAGDTVVSALALSMASGGSFYESAFIANAAASVVVEKLGAATVTPAELRKALKGAMKTSR